MARTSEIFTIDGDAVMKRTAGSPRPALAVAETATLAEPRAVSGEGRKSARPALAATLSMWIWGSGQFLNGDRDLAVLLAMWQVQIVALHYLVCMTWGSLTRLAHLFFVSEWEMLLACAALDFWFIFLWLFNVSQAYRSAERRRGVFTGLRRWYLSGLASLLIPGWGQILNGQRIKGLCFLFAFLTQGWVLAFWLLTPLFRLVSDLDPDQKLLRMAIQGGTVTLYATGLLWLMSVYDAVLVARVTRTRAR